MIVGKLRLGLIQSGIHSSQMLSVIGDLLGLTGNQSLHFIDLMSQLVHLFLHLTVFIMKFFLCSLVFIEVETLFLPQACDQRVLLLYGSLILKSYSLYVSFVLVSLFLDLQIALFFDAYSFLSQTLKL
jgi:hypothetical protein